MFASVCVRIGSGKATAILPSAGADSWEAWWVALTEMQPVTASEARRTARADGRMGRGRLA